MAKSYIFIFLAATLTFLSSKAQRIGVWKVHLPHNKPIAAAEFEDELFVGTSGGFYSFGLSNGEVKVYSKADGLSDIEVSAIGYNKSMNTLVVAYASSNIDLMKDGEIVNINDIYRFPVLGKKYIYAMYMSDRFVYLSCSFGIAKLDIERKEIVESYQNLGPRGENIAVNSVTILGDSIFAATDSGLIGAHLKQSNLADFNQWQRFTNTKCQKVVTYKNNLYAGIDSLLQKMNGTQFEKLDSLNHSGFVSLESRYDKLVVARSDSLLIYNENGRIKSYNATNTNFATLLSKGQLVVCSSNNSLYFIDQNGNNAFFTPNGPQSSKASDFAFENNNLWVAPEGPTSTWILSFNKDYFYKYDNSSWYNEQGKDTLFKSIQGIWKVAVRPKDKHIFFGSWGSGLNEYDGSSVIHKFTSQNTPLGATNIGGVSSTLIGGMAFDTASNLWFTNPQSARPIGVYTANGEWYNYSLGTVAGSADIITDLTIDDNGYKWAMMPRGKGIAVFDDGGTPAFTFDDQFKQITSEKTRGFLPSMDVRCLVKDQEGNIWVGTDKGLTVFYTPGNVFNGLNFDAQQIIISKNGKAAYLFGDLSINHIAVDAGNRKWIATRNGVYLVSPDGQNIIFNFNKTNSPLLSDYVQRIAISPLSGEVFFATDQGIVSYQGDALPGTDSFNDVVIYPNPVLAEYDGLIAIKGLYNNANVKITDIAGNIIYETRANGSVATWNGKNFKGEKAHTGIYLVISSNQDGTQTNVGKIMFYR